MMEEVVNTRYLSKPLTKERIMQRVSVRTLILMVLLLFSVVVHHYVDLTPAGSAGKNFTRSRPSDRARMTSVAVATPGISGMPRRSAK